MHDNDFFSLPLRAQGKHGSRSGPAVASSPGRALHIERSAIGRERTGIIRHTKFLREGRSRGNRSLIMGNALVWMLGISGAVIVFAYLAILAAILAAKRRMEKPLPTARPGRDAQSRNYGMRLRTP
jgi:hypothetical protein